MRYIKHNINKANILKAFKEARWRQNVDVLGYVCSKASQSFLCGGEAVIGMCNEPNVPIFTYFTINNLNLAYQYQIYSKYLVPGQE